MSKSTTKNKSTATKALKDVAPEGAVFKLVCLNDTSWVQTLSGGESVTVAGAVQIHLADASGNALVEILPNANGSTDGSNNAAHVAVDHQAVHDVSHLRAHQILTINNRAFVLLPPLSAFVQDRDDVTRRASLIQLVTGQEAESVVEVTDEVDTLDTATVHQLAPKKTTRRKTATPTPMAQLTAMQLQMSQPMTGAKPSGGLNSRLVSGALAVIGLTALGFSFIPKTPEAPVAPVTSIAAPASAIVAQPVNHAPVASVNVQAVNTEPLAAPAPAAPVTAPVAAVQVEEDISAPAVAAPAPVIAKRLPAVTKALQPVAKPVVRQAPAARVARQAPAASALNPKTAAALRQQIASFQLEGGFDPEGARAKLKALRSKAAGDASILRAIDKALSTIHE